MSRSVIGLTARYFCNKGLDVALSMSYCPKTDITTALMVGLTVRQTEFFRAQVCKLARIAHHPALVPTLMAESVRRVIVGRFFTIDAVAKSIEISFRLLSPMRLCIRAVQILKDLAILEMELEMLETQRAGAVDFVHLTSDGGLRSEKGKEKPRLDIVDIGLVLEERLDFLLITTKQPRAMIRMHKERVQAVLSIVGLSLASVGLRCALCSKKKIRPTDLYPN